jgi:NRAMP (natural resistance-associated macrophage protein)-like metal ion transporter
VGCATDMPAKRSENQGIIREAGVGLITGAAADDPSAIGTYASAGAGFGLSFLWTAPVAFPMMFAVVYLSAKLGQVAGEGLFAVLRKHYPRWLLYPTLIAVMIGNTLEAGADLGGIAAAIRLLVPLPAGGIVVVIAAVILAIQIWGSYTLIRNILRTLALALLAYVPAAILAKPPWGEVVRATLVPAIHFNRESLSMLVAIVGTTLSAYLYTWQSNEEVEEEKEMGRTRLAQRKGATNRELSRSRRDVSFGMFFSNIAMYAIILSTAATLHGTGKADISAADAAEALRPVAGPATGVLFTLGIIGVGFLAVPVMTSGAAYDLCQTLGWRSGLNERPSRARRFYIATAAFTAVAMSINFFGFNPMRALVVAGIVQGFSTPPLMLLILLMTNNRRIMGDRVNGRVINTLGGITIAAMFAATLCLAWTWIR